MMQKETKTFRLFGSEKRYILQRGVRNSAKRTKIDKASGADRVVHEFLKFGGGELGIRYWGLSI